MFLACRYGPCEAESLKERMKRAVALLGQEEVQSIMEQEGKIEVGAWRQLASDAQHTAAFKMLDPACRGNAFAIVAR